jgi:Flp pilus assembly protein TadG
MSGNRRMRQQVRRQQGSTLVEFAFVLLFVLTLLFGIIDVGRMLYVYHFVGNQAREGARWASVRGSTSLTPASPATIQAFVKDVPANMGLDPTKINPTVNFIAPPNGATGCGGAAPNPPGCVVQVQVSYGYTPLFPVPFLPNNTFTMSSTSEMVITQ